MLSSLIAGMVLLQVQEPVKDYQLPIMSVQEFGDWLGAQGGDTVIVSPEVADRNLYVNVKQRTLTEVVGMVEKAIGLRVLRENGAVTLLPGASISEDANFQFFDHNVQEMAELNLTEAQIDSAIKKVSELYQGFRNRQAPFDSWREIGKLERFNPSRSLMAQLIRAIGVQSLRAIPDGDRIVYSTMPTRLQRAWPLQAQSSLDWFNRMCDAKNAALLSYVPPPVSDDGDEEWSEEQTLGSFSQYGGRAEPIKAMLLIVTPDFPYFTLELRYFDEDGSSVAMDFEYFQAAIEESLDDVYNPEGLELYGKLDGELKLTQDEQVDLQLVSKLYDNSEGEEIVGSAGKTEVRDLEYMSTIDTRNPLSGAVSRIYDYACEVTGNELVREVFDSGYWDSYEVITAQEAAGHCFGYEKEFLNQLVVAEPDIYTLAFREYAVPRKPLAQLARVILRTGSLDIDTLANAVDQLGDRKKVGRFVTTAISMSSPDDVDMSMGGDGGYFGLELYSKLSPSDRQLVKSANGLVLDYSRMNAGVRWLFDDEVRRSELMVGYNYEQFPDDANDEYYEMSDTWRGEQTVFLADPKNYPPKVRLRFTQDVVVSMRVQSKKSSYSYTVDADEVGYYLYYLEKAKKEGKAEVDLVTFAPTEKMVLATDLLFGALPVMGDSFVMMGHRLSDFGSIEKLPESIRIKVLKAYEEYKKANEDGGDGNR